MLSLALEHLGAPDLTDAIVPEATRTLVGVVACLARALLALRLVAATPLLEVVAVRTATSAAGAV